MDSRRSRNGSRCWHRQGRRHRWWHCGRHSPRHGTWRHLMVTPKVSWGWRGIMRRPSAARGSVRVHVTKSCTYFTTQTIYKWCVNVSFFFFPKNKFTRVSNTNTRCCARTCTCCTDTLGDHDRLNTYFVQLEPATIVNMRMLRAWKGTSTRAVALKLLPFAILRLRKIKSCCELFFLTFDSFEVLLI